VPASHKASTSRTTPRPCETMRRREPDEAWPAGWGEGGWAATLGVR
jgi:hypothetical protein